VSPALPPGPIEPCPKCGATDYVVARNMRSTRSCRCGLRWEPSPKCAESNLAHVTEETVRRIVREELAKAPLVVNVNVAPITAESIEAAIREAIKRGPSCRRVA
jgi:hypothetical protein